MATEPQNEEALYYAAIMQPPAERSAYLKAASGADRGLLERVEALLSIREAEDNFLASPPFVETPLGTPLSAAALSGRPIGRLAVPEAPGTIIGRYKLLEKIGEGGMAVVYMAEQTEPLRRKVALKIIKLGMDTRQVIARFEAERQALALMDHPSIAKVFDAGSTETGRPYFVMELVQGVSITEYCDTNSLSTKDRLHLFLQVCQAVQHAHTKGIIHRDIKPSNVMVTHHDGKPIPKVIDFGIAKATNQKLTEKTLCTRYAHLIGTPAYMSPEQAELTDLDIDTRSDIYSLGVLLYELLTGTTPFSEEELRKAGYVEMQRVIREQEPVKPSTRIRTATRERRSGTPISRSALSSSQSGDWRSGRANQEIGGPGVGTGGTPMLREVRGDLDWIVMKTLEKDRARRYETASGLAEDIRRHLASEPILARGPSATYRLRRFLRRHRVQVLGGLTVGVLMTGVAVLLSLWNQDRLRLEEAQDLGHRAFLSQVQGLYASGDREAALQTIQPLLDSKHVGPEAQLLRAGLLVDNRHPDEAVTILKSLLGGRQEIAGAAHSLLARVLWESGPLDADRLKELEEHRRQAEALLPDTAEAYFLRAMTALTVKDQLAALDKALELDAKHYESRRLRAFTYYASRKYERMNEDALFMEAVRGRDPLGYSLRATALRELGRYQDALRDYDQALALTAQSSPQHFDLATQRGETLLRMGDYEHAVVEAEACRKLWPDKPVFQYHLFCARTAQGEYEKADVLFQEIVRRTPTARNEFWFWVTKYVFDTLEAGQSWHPPDRQPAGAAFLPLVEAEETYRSLSAKGHRILTDGFNAQWSPDRTRLAFSLGVHGYSGVAVYDPATKETELLIVPGKNPRWSPDGRYIAFVRDRQFMRVEELVATDPKNQSQPRTDEEVWLMESDGTKPRRLTRGTWPSWGRDSTHIYYQSSSDFALYSISIIDSDIQPERLIAGPLFCPSVSPDNRRAAYVSQYGSSLKVSDLASQTSVAEWDLPFGIWSPPAWSPTGEELSVGTGSSAGDRTGLWIYRLDGKERVRVLDSQIMSAAWAPDGTKLVFGLRPPYFELWTADLNPAISTMKALGPGQTLDEHWQDMLRLYTRRIDTDPHDAYAYFDRARCWDYLHEGIKAEADMKRWSTIMTAGSSADTARTFRHVLRLPFNCELVFSAERPVNRIPTMSVAFGQKGRCEMKLFEIPMVVTSLLGLCCLSEFDASPAHANFTLGKPTNLGPTFNGPDHDCQPSLSPDGLSLYFSRGYPGDIWVARRVTSQSDWGEPAKVGPALNSLSDDGRVSLSADGLSIYLDSERPGGSGILDLWVATRARVSDEWGIPVNLGTTVNSTAWDFAPCLSADGLELYFSSKRPGGLGKSDLWRTTRATTSDGWSAPINLGPAVNSPGDEMFTSLSADGLVFFFQSDRPGGYGGVDVYMTRRTTTKDPWGPAMNLGPAINDTSDEGGPEISPDGSTLYFQSSRSGGFGLTDLWQVPILPVADFDGDGKVDSADMSLLGANFGKSQTLCDIGPLPWGDGVVDERDLRVLMESLMVPGPRSTDVLSDAVLSWNSPSFAQTCDVYLGTSFEALNSASRANPQGVLVSQGQTAAAYDPAGPLEFSKTYYWRVDFVISDPAPAIYQGPVLRFTTAASAYPIKNITVTASTMQAGSGPERTVDRSGLDQNDGHSTEAKEMWWSTGAGSNWIQYEFDRVYNLHELWVWNFNTMLEPFMGFGAKTVKIEYSTDGTAWTPLANATEFKKAPGKPAYLADTKISFGGVPAKFVKLTIERNWGVAPQTGLSEVRFFATQSAEEVGQK